MTWTVSLLQSTHTSHDANLTLADASVTQSALEEALASKMQGGNTIGSTISNVFRSRYLPK